MRVREALNVKAGLNGSFSVPFMLFFIALAAAKVERGFASLSQFIIEQLGYGLLVGLGTGLCGGWLPGPGKAKTLVPGLLSAGRCGHPTAHMHRDLRHWRQFDARLFLYAVLSLTVVRTLPVVIALTGTGLCRAS